MKFTVELTIWVDPDHPEVNTANPARAVVDVLDLVSEYLYEDDYIRIEDISVKEDS